MAMAVTDMADMFKAMLAAMEEAGVPDDLRAVAFAKGLDLLAAGSHRPGGVPPATGEEPSAPSEGGMARIAAKLSVSVDAAREVFDLDGDRLDLIVPPGRLDKTKARATREIGLLISAARQASSLDTDWTPTSTIRDACTEFGKYDSANFATSLNTLGNLCSFRGKGQQREVRVNRQGLEEAGVLVRRLSGLEA